MTKRTAEQALRDERAKLLKDQSAWEARAERAEATSTLYANRADTANKAVREIGNHIARIEAALSNLGAELGDDDAEDVRPAQPEP
jgi:hypothetical protein